MTLSNSFQCHRDPIRQQQRLLPRELVSSAAVRRVAVGFSPEAAPSNVVLAEVLQLCGLDNQLVNLVDDVQLLAVLKVAARQLEVDTMENFHRLGVLNLSLLRPVDQVAVWGG